MRLARKIHQRLRAVFRRSAFERDLQQELAIHLEQLAREYRAAGLGDSEAEAAARRAFGGISVTAEECRDTRRVRFLEDAGKDLAYAFRLLAKSPGFTATAILSLALGIGANTAIFGLLKQVVFDLLPVHDPARIVAISRTSLAAPAPNSSFSNAFLRDLQSAPGLPFDGFLGFDRSDRIALLAGDSAEPVSVEFVSGNYFELLGVRPALGRLLAPSDDGAPAARAVAVLSHRFWTRRFGADPSVLNRTIHLNNYPFTVAGVSARGFDGLEQGNSPDIRIPITMAVEVIQFPGQSPLANRGNRWIQIFGRIKGGVANARAADALAPVLLRDHDLAPGRAQWTDYWKRVVASERLFVTPAAQGTAAQRSDYERAIWILFGMVTAVLLLACVNIAHLVLARASTREREFSIRLAVGAGRGRLVRQLLTESLLLGLCGGAAGLLAAYGLGRILIALVVTDGAHATLTAAPNAAMLAFNFSVALAASVGFGLAPARRSSRLALAPGLSGARSGRLTGRKIMIGVQVSFALALLAAAGLFARSLENLRGIDIGFPADHLLQIGVNASGYAPERLAAFYSDVVEQTRSLPGVRAVTYGRQRLVAGDAWSSGIVVDGFAASENDHGPNRDSIGPGYFSAVGIPLVTGREFTDADNAAAPKVAIVNEAFARFYFAGENPLGRRIGPGGSKPDFTIVGVARDAKYHDMREAPTRFWYVPFAQLRERSAFRSLNLFVRASVDPESLTAGIREAVARVDKRVTLFDIKTIGAQIGDDLRLERLMATLSIFFGAAAALLAAAGLFGVLAYSVAQRRREIGIRIAVGARPSQAAWSILRGIAIFVLLGVAAGVPLALALSSLVRRMLFGIQPDDPLTLAVSAVGMAALAAVAALLPASQAARIEPATTLKAE